MKDYPIEENPELTIRSVLNNLMLYHEGWGVGKMKHSLTYSGGLSRGYMRTYTTADHEKLYALKGQVVASGVKAITGMEMPAFEKRRFQHGAASSDAFQAHFPNKELDYRKEFLSIYE